MSETKINKDITELIKNFQKEKQNLFKELAKKDPQKYQDEKAFLQIEFNSGLKVLQKQIKGADKKFSQSLSGKVKSILGAIRRG